MEGERFRCKRDKQHGMPSRMPFTASAFDDLLCGMRSWICDGSIQVDVYIYVPRSKSVLAESVICTDWPELFELGKQSDRLEFSGVK